ncbi:hypothetical protein CEXT_384581 [Caerostris extrusa]|uniref:Uncharacterized protein n=1 Tax=Caerostris extrusa TaxID=172846 RepID=A0AAV4TX21_CAEEX|nr:hypothetical protein CEXT_384581 [Caerostris extrusa]
MREVLICIHDRYQKSLIDTGNETSDIDYFAAGVKLMLSRESSAECLEITVITFAELCDWLTEIMISICNFLLWYDHFGDVYYKFGFGFHHLAQHVTHCSEHKIMHRQQLYDF